MGRFAHLVDSPAAMEGFRVLYHIPQGISLWYCSLGEWLTHKNEGDVVILMIAFIKGGMTLPMGMVTRNYLIIHRRCPHQCVSNLFRILGSLDALNKQIGLNLTRHDVVWMYECHLLADLSYYLKSRSSVIRLVSCLSKSNKSMKDDNLIASSERHDVLHYPTREGELGGVPYI